QGVAESAGPALALTINWWRWRRRGSSDGAVLAGVVVSVSRGLAALVVGGDAGVGRQAGGVGLLGSSTDGTRRGWENRRAGDVAARAPRVPAAAGAANGGVPGGVVQDTSPRRVVLPSTARSPFAPHCQNRSPMKIGIQIDRVMIR